MYAENYKELVKCLNNPTNQGMICSSLINDGWLIIDTKASDLRLYRERVSMLRSQRGGIFYIKDARLKELTGYEALLLQGFFVEYANSIKNLVSDRYLLMQIGNMMIVNVISEIEKSIIKI